MLRLTSDLQNLTDPPNRSPDRGWSNLRMGDSTSPAGSETGGFKLKRCPSWLYSSLAYMCGEQARLFEWGATRMTR